MKPPRTERIRTAFAMAARHYDDHAAVQRRAARALADMAARWQMDHCGAGGADIGHDDGACAAPHILEIGCGTGALTHHIHQLFPQASIIATDIAPEMIDAARRKMGGRDIAFRVMDGEAPCFAAGSFDLIFSSLTFQWFSDMPGAVNRLRALLRPGGSLFFATMARRSFQEWRAAHGQCGLKAGTPLYPTRQDIEGMLDGHGDYALYEEEYQQDFGGARGLLAHVRGIGATVPAEGRVGLSAGQLRQVMRVFDEMGGRCTYHILYARLSRENIMKGNEEGMMEHPVIHIAQPEDAAQLAALKSRTFRETFVNGPIAIAYSAENLAVFEEKQYSIAAVRAELEDPRHVQWVIKDGDGRLIAYAHAGPCKLPHEDAKEDHAELYQLYVAAPWQGAGLGRVLLDRVMNWAGEERPGPLWLGVYSGNERAQAVYRARGFVKVGEYDYKVGDHRDHEYIMRRG